MARNTVNRVVASDAEIDAAIARGRLLPDRRVVGASYDPANDEIAIVFANRARLTIPRPLLQGLTNANVAELGIIEILGPGTGLYWPTLDVAHYVAGLIDGVFGTKAWMAEAGRRGGAVRSPAKAAAARKNGKRGGRPKRST